MSKKTTVGMLLISIFILSGIFAIIPTDIQSSNFITTNLNNNLTNSSISVTHPSDLEILVNDTANYTIPWTLTDDYLEDYLGLYSFTGDANGANPTGWTTTEPVNTTIQVINDWVGHHKVVELRDDNVLAGQECIMTNSFSARSQGTIEFWVYGTSSTTELDLYGSGSRRIVLVFHFGNHYLRDWVGGGSDPIIISSPGLTTNVWHHIRITFDRSAGNFIFYYDGVNKGTFPWWSTGANIDQARWWSSALDGNETGIRTFIDAMDYSWATGYYTNRNMNNRNLTYAIFDNDVQKMIPQTWSNQTTVYYTVNRTSLGLGMHNISLVFNDRSGKLFHDDVQATVIDPEHPKIFEVIQNPVIPTYQAVVNITAHITDNDQIQTVLLETNSTENGVKDYLGAYSFTSDLDGSVPSGWTRPYKNLNTDGKIISEKAGHRKVIEMYDNNPTGYTVLRYDFPGQITGTMEWWFYGTQAGLRSNFQIAAFNDPGINGILLVINMSREELLYFDVSNKKICNLSNNNWHHFRMPFNCTTDKFDIWIDGVQQISGANFVTDRTNISRLELYTGAASTGGFYVYFDAIDFSWAPGYYVNRNIGFLGFTNYSMTLLSGSQNDGVWSYTFDNYPTNKSISYRILAQDISGNWNTTDYYSFGYFDTVGPNIASVTQTPSEPDRLDVVNVTAHLTDATQVQTVSIETNYTGTLSTYPMTLLSGSSQDGIWKYSFGVFPVNKSIFYRVITSDVLGNQNSTGYYGFGYFDTNGPNIASVTQTPSEPDHLDVVNVTAHLTDATQVQTVFIETNSTGTLSTYPMTLLSGSSQDGVWKYSFGAFHVNNSIYYRVITSDVLGNQNSTGYYSFGYFDTLAPNIISIIQSPSTPTYLEIVNVTVHLTDATQVQTVAIQTNYTGTLSTYPMVLISGSTNDGIWIYVFGNYPLNAVIIYSILTQDIFGNANSSSQSSFGVFDLIDPTILIVVQTPATLTRWDSVQVTSHVQENFALGSVMINSNHTGSWANYPMVLLNGSLQDGFWGFTIANYPYNKSIWYRVSAIDVVGRTTTTGYSQFGIFPIVSNHVPLDLEIDVDVGMAGNRKADITFTFQNTGNTNLVNINFTIHLPIGWTANTLVRSVSQLAPGQTVTITFKITVPSNVNEFLELVLIDVDARIAELGMDWPTQSIEVVVSGVKVWDLFIWLIVIVGSCSAAVATTYVYIHKRSASQKVLKNKFKGKTLISLKTAISNDFPGNYAVISIELMERINNISGLTDEERQLLIDDVAQLEGEQAEKWIDDYEKSLIQ